MAVLGETGLLVIQQHAHPGDAGLADRPAVQRQYSVAGQLGFIAVHFDPAGRLLLVGARRRIRGDAGNPFGQRHDGCQVEERNAARVPGRDHRGLRIDPQPGRQLIGGLLVEHRKATLRGIGRQSGPPWLFGPGRLAARHPFDRDGLVVAEPVRAHHPHPDGFGVLLDLIERNTEGKSRQAGIRIPVEGSGNVFAFAPESGIADMPGACKHLDRGNRSEGDRPALHQQHAIGIDRAALDVHDHVGTVGCPVGDGLARTRHQRNRWFGGRIQIEFELLNPFHSARGARDDLEGATFLRAMRLAWQVEAEGPRAGRRSRGRRCAARAFRLAVAGGTGHPLADLKPCLADRHVAGDPA